MPISIVAVALRATRALPIGKRLQPRDQSVVNIIEPVRSRAVAAPRAQTSSIFRLLPRSGASHEQKIAAYEIEKKRDYKKRNQGEWIRVRAA
jgi:hypothetical protein